MLHARCSLLSVNLAAAQSTFTRARYVASSVSRSAFNVCFDYRQVYIRIILTMSKWQTDAAIWLPETIERILESYPDPKWSMTPYVLIDQIITGLVNGGSYSSHGLDEAINLWARQDLITRAGIIANAIFDLQLVGHLGLMRDFLAAQELAMANSTSKGDAEYLKNLAKRVADLAARA